MPQAGDDEPIVPLSDIVSGEIYAISIQNGKVRVQGGEPHRINPNSEKGSDFFVFYPGKAVFGVVVRI